MLNTARPLQNAATQIWGRVDKLDRDTVRERIAAMKRANPRTSRDALHKKLVYNNCLQAGVVGAVSGMAGLVPVLGRVAQTVLGPLADAALVTTLQAELVAETFALYDMDMPDHTERMAVLAVAATNIGAASVSKQAAKAVATQAAKLIGGTLARRAMPVVGVATTAAANIGITYLIGMRAQALAKMKDAPLEDWPDLIRGVTSLDERKLAQWAAEAARNAIDSVGDTAVGWLAKLNAYVRPMIPGTSHSKRVEPKRAKAVKRGGAAKRAARKAPARRRKAAKP